MLLVDVTLHSVMKFTEKYANVLRTCNTHGFCICLFYAVLQLEMMCFLLQDFAK